MERRARQNVAVVGELDAAEVAGADARLVLFDAAAKGELAVGRLVRAAFAARLEVEERASELPLEVLVHSREKRRKGEGVRLPERGRDEGREALDAVAVEGGRRVDFEGLGVREERRKRTRALGLLWLVRSLMRSVEVTSVVRSWGF